MNLILLGAQGSGKGTQGALLAARFGLALCASGELLREAISQGTPIGQQVRPYYDRGDLVPDELMVGMILERLTSLRDARGIILDGFPRNLAQAQVLDARLAELRHEISQVIYLDVPRDLLRSASAGAISAAPMAMCITARQIRQRHRAYAILMAVSFFSGTMTLARAIEKRLDIFFTETLPQLKSHYEPLGKLVTIDGTQSIDDVTREILTKLDVSEQ